MPDSSAIPPLTHPSSPREARGSARPDMWAMKHLGLDRGATAPPAADMGAIKQLDLDRGRDAAARR